MDSAVKIKKRTMTTPRRIFSNSPAKDALYNNLTVTDILVTRKLRAIEAFIETLAVGSSTAPALNACVVSCPTGNLDLTSSTNVITVNNTLDAPTVQTCNVTCPTGPLALSSATNVTTITDTLDVANVQACNILCPSGDLDLSSATNRTTITDTLEVANIEACNITCPTGPLLLSAPTSVVQINGNFAVFGLTSTVTSTNVNIADNTLYLNADYTVPAPFSGGLAVNYLPTAVAFPIAGNFVAGVPAVSNPTVDTTGTGFVAGDVIQISGAFNPANNGLFEVDSHIAGVLTIRGIGLVTTTTNIFATQFVASAPAGGTATRVNVSTIVTDTTGDWRSYKGSNSGSFIPGFIGPKQGLIRLTIPSWTQNVQTWYANFAIGDFVNVLGTGTSFLSIAAALPAGNSWTVTDPTVIITSARLYVQNQTPNVGAQNRLFVSLLAPGFNSGVASSYPISNNWRSSNVTESNGITSGIPVTMSVLYQSGGTLTFNGAYMVIEWFQN
jgi:Fe-S-cluster-containing hydrogenase component 2